MNTARHDILLPGLHATAVEPAHDHRWSVESRHATSLGHVLYERCVDCGVRRVDLLTPDALVPSPMSIELGTRRG